jgi:hypothetical protein
LQERVRERWRGVWGEVKVYRIKPLKRYMCHPPFLSPLSRAGEEFMLETIANL